MRCGQQLLDSVELAEEAVQDAFVRYHDRGASPAPGKELAYLRAAVRNNACSMMRRRQLSAKHRSRDPEPIIDLDDALIRRDEGDQVRIAMTRLSGRQREILELRYWHNLSEQQMADQLNMTTGSVKTHSSRARARLREELDHLVA